MLREMTPDDLAEVFEVRTATIENAISMEQLQQYGITIESLTIALQTDVKGWVDVASNKITGFVMGNSSTAELEVLAVLPEYDRRGIGAALLMQMQAWLFSNGHKRIWLKTTPDKSLRAYGFYQHFGWQPTGEIDGEDEIFVLSLKK